MKIKSLFLATVLAATPALSWGADIDSLQIRERIYDTITGSQFEIYKIDKKSDEILLKRNAESLETLPRKSSEIVKGVENLGDLKARDLISFYDNSRRKFDYGTVSTMYENGMVFFKVQFFEEHTTNFRTYIGHISHLGLSVAEKDGFKAGQKICYRGEKGDLDTVFSNGTGKMVIGDFFGKRFFIFEQWKIVELNQLENCQ